MNDCLFCKIINKEIPCNFEHEDDECIAIHDIHPKAKTHILIIPKAHIETVAHINEGEEQIIGHLVKIANKIAKKRNLSGYKLLFNVGEDGGQEVFHIHLHLTGN